MKGSFKLYLAVYLYCVIQVIYWLCTLQFTGCDPEYNSICFEIWFYGYTPLQEFISKITIAFQLGAIGFDWLCILVEEKRPTKYFNPFYYINIVADKYLED